MPLHLTAGSINELIHALLVGGLVAVRYLWPLWLIIIALWLVTRGLRAIAAFLGFAPAPRKPARPAARSRR